MADKIYKVDYFKVSLPNRAGEGAKVLNALKKHGVNLLGFTGFPSGGKSQVDFIPKNAGLFTKAAKKIGLRVSKKKTGFLAQGKDRIGAVANVLEKLSRSKINVTAIDALCAGKGRFGAIFWVKPQQAAKAAKILKASKL